MKRRLTATMLMAGLVTAPFAGLPSDAANAQSVVKPNQTVILSIGRGQLVNVPGTMADVFVANDAIADVQIKSKNQLYLFGKASGETTIYASNAAGNIIWSANVRIGSNLDSVDQMLALAMPEAKINVATMGTNTVLLTGIIAAPEDAAEAERLVQAFVGENTNVISRLKMATPLQVNLRVRFAEVSRSLVRQIGSKLTSADSTGDFKFGISVGGGSAAQYAPRGSTLFTGATESSDGTSLVKGGAGTTLAGFGKLLGLDLGAALELAETQGLITTLAQPNLTALSGETANFLAGGEFPVLTNSGLGTTSVIYRKYGVSLSYTPTVLANGRISIRVLPEVSELSSAGSITMGGFEVPALTVRRAETTVELGSGQSFMIAGLMSNNASQTIDKAPGLGDVPILGNLFRSRSFRKGETELVIVVTPYLVKPVNDGDIKLPTDGFQAASEVEALIGYKTTANAPAPERPMPMLDNQSAPGDPAQPWGEPQATQDKNRNSERRADKVAAPGFNLK